VSRASRKHSGKPQNLLGNVRHEVFLKNFVKYIQMITATFGMRMPPPEKETAESKAVKKALKIKEK
jgi:hypothetical protein